MNPTSSRHQRHAAMVRQAWPTMSRRNRRAGARWYWQSCHRFQPSWNETWRAINANQGVITHPLDAAGWPSTGPLRAAAEAIQAHPLRLAVGLGYDGLENAAENLVAKGPEAFWAEVAQWDEHAMTD